MKLDPSIGADILSDLRTRFPMIPRKGILAGGAVADWILGIDDINDLDVFVEATGNEKRFFGVATANFGVPEVDYNGYEGLTCIARKDTYQVVSSTRDGILNTIACIAPQKLTAARVISGFDLNATRVAIDLETERLVWDDSFALFLKTRQLKVTAMFTPAHTAIRFFLKKHRLQCEGDDQLDMNILMHAWKFFDAAHAHNNAIAFHFGQQTLTKAERALELGLSRYFSLESAGKFWTLQPRPEAQCFAFNDEHLDFILMPSIGADAMRAQSIVCSESYVEKIASVREASLNVHVDRMVDLYQGAYVRGKLTERNVRIVSAFLNRHPCLAGLFYGLSNERQMQVIRRFFRVARRHGPWIYRMAQECAVQIDVVSNEAFDALVNTHQAHFDAKLTTALPAHRFLWYRMTACASRKEIATAAYLFRMHERHVQKAMPYADQRVKLQLVTVRSDLSKQATALLGVSQSIFGYLQVDMTKPGPMGINRTGLRLAIYWLDARLCTFSQLEALKRFAKTVYLDAVDRFSPARLLRKKLASV